MAASSTNVDMSYLYVYQNPKSGKMIAVVTVIILSIEKDCIQPQLKNSNITTKMVLCNPPKQRSLIFYYYADIKCTVILPQSKRNSIEL